MFLAVLLLLTSICAAQDLNSAALEFGRKLLAATGKQEAVMLSVHNISSLSAAETAEIARVLESQFRDRKVQAAMRFIEIDVTLSENLNSFVWVADIRKGEQRDVAITHVARSSTAPSTRPLAVTLVKKLLLERDEQILDISPGEDFTLVLSADKVSIYQQQTLRRTISIAPRIFPRDARGRLIAEPDMTKFTAYLPGLICNGVTPANPTMTCRPSSGPWPMDGDAAALAEGRNYFVQENLLPFFSKAVIGGDVGKVELLAEVDGTARLYDGSLQPIGTFSGWGSDVASVESACRGSLVLATKPTGSSEADAIQAYEISGRGALPAGDPIEFPGPVTALWTSVRGAAVAVARDLQTGRYAAYSLAIRCDR